MDRQRYSVAGLFQAYAAQKASEEWRGEWAVVLFYRPVAIVASSLLLRLPVSPTAVTLASLLAALSLPVFALYGGESGYAAVALLAVLAVILDCIDGTVARARGLTSKFGHYLDFATDVVYRICLYASIGLIAALHPSRPLWLGSWTPAATVLAATLAVTARLCRVYAELLTGGAERPPAQRRGAAALLFSAISGLDHLTPLFLLLAGTFHALGWLALWLLFYSALDFLHTQLEILSRLR